MNENKLQNQTGSEHKCSNFRKPEFEALKYPKSNSDIIIKKAEKGSAVVIQDRTDYITEGLRQSNDQDFYGQVDTHLTCHHTYLECRIQPTHEVVNYYDWT